MKHLVGVADEVRRLSLDRGVAAAVQHQPRLAAEQPGGVDTKREIAPDAPGGVFGDEALGLLVVPEILHVGFPYRDGG